MNEINLIKRRRYLVDKPFQYRPKINTLLEKIEESKPGQR